MDRIDLAKAPMHQRGEAVLDRSFALVVQLVTYIAVCLASVPQIHCLFFYIAAWCWTAHSMPFHSWHYSSTVPSEMLQAGHNFGRTVNCSEKVGTVSKVCESQAVIGYLKGTDLRIPRQHSLT